MDNHPTYSRPKTNTIKIGYNIVCETARQQRIVDNAKYLQAYFEPSFYDIVKLLRKKLIKAYESPPDIKVAHSERVSGEKVYTAIIFFFISKDPMIKKELKNIMYGVIDDFLKDSFYRD